MAGLTKSPKAVSTLIMVKQILSTRRSKTRQLVVHFRYALTDETDEGVYAGSVPYTSAGGHHYILLKNRADVAIADSRGAAIEPLSVQADG